MSKFNNIQILRCISAILVVVDHSLGSLIRKGFIDSSYQELAWHLGDLGVMTFFIISGFIMHTTATCYSSFNAALFFFKKRVTRVLPVYWLATLLAFAMSLIVKANITYSWMDLFRSLFFIPYTNDITLPARPVLGQGWTLNYEMFFYLLFSISLVMSRLVSFAFISTVFILLLIVGLYISPLTGYKSFSYFYTDKIIITFLVGIFISVFSKAKKIKFNQVYFFPIVIISLLMAMINFSFFYGFHLYVFMVSFLCCAFIVFISVLSQPSEGIINNILISIGDSSYSLYLFHVFVLAILNRVLPSSIGNLYSLIYIILSVLFSVVLAKILYISVEIRMCKTFSYLIDKTFKSISVKTVKI